MGHVTVESGDYYQLLRCVQAIKQHAEPSITPMSIARRFVGVKEVPGQMDNVHIMSMLKLDADWPESDEVPWCSAFVNYVAWLAGVARTESLRARSWLNLGGRVALADATPGFDVVVLKRGGPNQPGPEVIKAPGHVGFYLSQVDDEVTLLGGNQSDSVCIARYPVERVLGVRRLGVA